MRQVLLIKQKKTHYFYAFLAVFILATSLYFIYLPGLSGPYIFDDFPNIVQNKALDVTDLSWSAIKEAIFAVQSGPLYRPVSYASFLMNIYYSGLDPFGFKFTNVVIHFLNTLLLFIFLYRFYSFCFQKGIVNFGSTQTAVWMPENILLLLSLFGSLFWAFHPLNVSAVLYVVQRMTSLSFLFFMLSLNFYLFQRLNQFKIKKISFIYLFFCLLFFLMALFSKESALCGLAIFFLLELFIFDCVDSSGKKNKFIFYFCLTCVFLFFLCFLLVLLEKNWLERGYSIRDFTLSERVLTQFRVLWLYVQMIFIPDIRDMSIFKDDLVVSTSLFSPISTFVSIASWFLFAIFVFFKRKNKMLVFGVLWFFSGHVLESTILPLEIMFDHRNYFPMVGLVILISLGIYSLILIAHRLKWILFILPILLNAIGTYSRAHIWKDELSLHQSEAHYHPLSARANFSLGLIYLSVLAKEQGKNTLAKASKKELISLAEQSFLKADQVYLNSISGYLGLMQLYFVIGEKEKADFYKSQLFDRLSKVRLNVDINRRVKEFFYCRYEESCPLDIGFYNGLIHALERNPDFKKIDSSGMYNDVAVLTMSYQLYEPSIYYLKKARELYPHNGDFVYNLAIAYLLNNQAVEAKRLLDSFGQSTLPKSYLKKFSDLSESAEKKLKEENKLD